MVIKRRRFNNQVYDNNMFPLDLKSTCNSFFAELMCLVDILCFVLRAVYCFSNFCLLRYDFQFFKDTNVVLQCINSYIIFISSFKLSFTKHSYNTQSHRMETYCSYFPYHGLCSDKIYCSNIALSRNNKKSVEHQYIALMGIFI